MYISQYGEMLGDPAVKRLVLDVLKPHEPPIYDLTSKLASRRGIDNVHVTAEIDRSTESIKVTIDGTDISIETVKKRIEEPGAVIHSVDEVLVARKPTAKT